MFTCYNSVPNFCKRSIINFKREWKTYTVFRPLRVSYGLTFKVIVLSGEIFRKRARLVACKPGEYTACFFQFAMTSCQLVLIFNHLKSFLSKSKHDKVTFVPLVRSSASYVSVHSCYKMFEHIIIDVRKFTFYAQHESCSILMKHLHLFIIHQSTISLLAWNKNAGLRNIMYYVWKLHAFIEMRAASRYV